MMDKIKELYSHIHTPEYLTRSTNRRHTIGSRATPSRITKHYQARVIQPFLHRLRLIEGVVLRTRPKDPSSQRAPLKLVHGVLSKYSTILIMFCTYASIPYQHQQYRQFPRLSPFVHTHTHIRFKPKAPCHVEVVIA